MYCVDQHELNKGINAMIRINNFVVFILSNFVWCKDIKLWVAVQIKRKNRNQMAAIFLFCVFCAFCVNQIIPR